MIVEFFKVRIFNYTGLNSVDAFYQYKLMILDAKVHILSFYLTGIAFSNYQLLKKKRFLYMLNYIDSAMIFFQSSSMIFLTDIALINY